MLLLRLLGLLEGGTKSCIKDHAVGCCCCIPGLLQSLLQLLLLLLLGLFGGEEISAGTKRRIKYTRAEHCCIILCPRELHGAFPREAATCVG